MRYICASRAVETRGRVVFSRIRVKKRVMFHHIGWFVTVSGVKIALFLSIIAVYSLSMSVNDLVLTKMGVRFKGRMIPCSIGRGGVRRDKREGDGATPVGAHRISGLYYRPDRMTRPVSWAVPIGLRDLWSDDVTDSRYNQLVQAPYGHSHETMRRADPLYDAVLITDWNWPDAIKGKGSAIFLHVYRSPSHSTEGCIAFSRQNLLWIIKRIKPGTRVIVAG